MKKYLVLLYAWCFFFVGVKPIEPLKVNPCDVWIPFFQSIAHAVIIGRSQAPTGWSCSYIFCENWEGSESISGCTGAGTADNSGWTCTEGATGSIDADNSTYYYDCGWTSSSEGLLITNPADELNHIEIDLGDPDTTCGIFLRFKVVNLTDAAYAKFMLLYGDDTSANPGCFVFYVQAESGTPPTSYDINGYWRLANGNWSSLTVFANSLPDDASWHTLKVKWSANTEFKCQVDSLTETSSSDVHASSGVDKWYLGPTDGSADAATDMAIECIQISSSYEYPSGS